ncbi:hypothetical protein GCM10022224_079330 [Nonomuraea antimicrobica]|uniref:Alpha/beta hydrolase n=2 Tax=Nonomuraea antimicrobica TaxID=561173 RepID=A0ABP7D9P1_9ACTN
MVVCAVPPGAAAAEPLSVQAVAGGVAGVRVPELKWKACADVPQLQCASVAVPLDYARPNGRSVTLALARIPAKDPARRLGSLVVNR